MNTYELLVCAFAIVATAYLFLRWIQVLEAREAHKKIRDDLAERLTALEAVHKETQSLVEKTARTVGGMRQPEARGGL